MRRALLFLLVFAAGLYAVSYNEDFLTENAKDPVTTAFWNTCDGNVVLPLQAPVTDVQTGFDWQYHVSSTGSRVYGYGRQDVTAFNSANPLAPVKIGTRALPSGSLDWFPCGESNANYIFACIRRDMGSGNEDSFLGVIPISDASFSSGTPISYSSSLSVSTSYALSSALSGNALAIGTSSDGVHLFDVSSPLSPQARAILSGGNSVEDLTFGPSNLLYVVGDSASLRIYDVSNLAAPVLRGEISTGERGLSVKVAGSVAYVFTKHSLLSFNVANPSAIVQLDQYLCAGDDFSDVDGSTALQGNFLYRTFKSFSVTNGIPARVLVFDVSVPSDLKLKGDLKYPGPYSGGYFESLHPMGTALWGSFGASPCCTSGGIAVFDVRNINLYAPAAFAQSIDVLSGTESVGYAILTTTQSTPASTTLSYFLSNGGSWEPWTLNVRKAFAVPRTNVLKWKSDLATGNTLVTPLLDDLHIQTGPCECANDAQCTVTSQCSGFTLQTRSGTCNTAACQCQYGAWNDVTCSASCGAQCDANADCAWADGCLPAPSHKYRDFAGGVSGVGTCNTDPSTCSCSLPAFTDVCDLSCGASCTANSDCGSAPGDICFATSCGCNQPPILSPGGPYNAPVGTPVLLSGSATDPDFPLSRMASLSWTSAESGCTLTQNAPSGQNTATMTRTATFSCTTNGPKTVVLSGADNLGKIASQNVQVVFNNGNQPPHADFSANPSSGNAPLTVQFTDLSTDDAAVVSWQWDFQNDGVVDSVVQNPSFVFTTPAAYSVQLTVRDGAGLSDTVAKTVTVSSGSGTPTPTPIPIPGSDTALLFLDCPRLTYENSTNVTLQCISGGQACPASDVSLAGAAIIRTERDGNIFRYELETALSTDYSIVARFQGYSDSCMITRTGTQASAVPELPVFLLPLLGLAGLALLRRKK